MKNIIVAIIIALSVCCPLTTKTTNNHSNDVNNNYEILAGELKPENANPDENLDIPLAAYASTTYDTYMEAYYRALTQNMGENQKGSCGYVAIGELLSYYDSYLNDYLIDDKYDVASKGSGTDMIARAQSPGILNDGVTYAEYSKYATSIDKLSHDDYYTIMSGKANSSLHAKLITIGKKLGYYKNSTTLKYPCATYHSERVNILKNYFSEIGLGDEFYTIKTCTGSSSDVKNFVKENIDKGNPVITGVYKSSSDYGHVVISYDYDSSNIYCNMGWSGSSSYAHYSIESRYDTYTDAIVVEFDFGHYHSPNYEVTTGGKTTKYCYCNCNILTYKNVGHSYTDKYVDDRNNATHKSYCRCKNLSGRRKC